MRRILAAVFLSILMAPVADAQTTGSISGTVTLRETAFEFRPSIQIYDTSGNLVTTVSLGQTASTQQTSTDTIPWTATGLAPGTYYVRTFSPATLQSTFSVSFTDGGWIDELFDNIPCVAADCSPASGTPVVVTAGHTRSGVNFTLDVGAMIRGFGNATFQGAQSYDIFDSRGVRLPNRIITAGAGYIADGLPGGTYYLLAHRALDNSAPETLYQNLPCDGCAVTSGTPVTVALGDNKTGINFGTPASGTISGTVRSNGSANPPNTAQSGVTVSVYAPNDTLVTTATTASDGTYSVAALAPGTYFLTTSNVQGFVDQIYGTISCAGCNPTTGIAVSVSAGSTTSGIDFSLPPGTIVSGTVAAASGVPLQPTIVIYSSTPDAPAARVVPVIQESPSGVPFATYGVTLPQGSYFVQTDPLPGYVQQIYNGVACPQGVCATSFATPVTVGATAVSGISFTLPACTASTIAPVSLATAAVGVAYRQTLLATGANGPGQFFVTSGTLPPGLALDPATGVLSGTPTTSGRFTFTVSAVDSSGCAGSRTYTLDVPACPFTVIPGPATATAAGGPWFALLKDTCGTFTATSNVPWLTVTSVGATGLAGTMAANAGGPRQGTVTVGPRVLTLNQPGVVGSPPFGSVDAPADGTVVSGSVALSGWALDDVFVVRVQIYRDPVAGEPAQLIFVGNATFVSGARPDVEAAYPALPFNNRAGWGYLLLTNMLPNGGNGTFRFSIYADDASLSHTLLGTRVINAVNASATAPFGAIDTPDQGATASGSSFVNFGWALTPQPKLIPFDGSTIRVLIDGVSVGNVTAYNLFRPDVSGLFPGLKNSGGPVGYRVIDTTALSEGTHTIAWLATDDGGITTGIGSRYFTVQNSAWQPSLRANLAATPPAVTSSELAHADATTPVPARVDGVDLGRKAASLASLPVDDAGARTLAMTNLQALELSLVAGSEGPAYGSTGTGCPATYAGYLVVNGELKPLPTGSALDPAGTFYWHPGPGFFGTYRLLFVRTGCENAQTRIPVMITIK